MFKIFVLPTVFLLASFALWGSDTLEFYSEKLTPQEIQKEVNGILQSKDLHDDAALYNRTGIHFANNEQYDKALGYFFEAIKLYDSVGAIKEKAVCFGYLSSVYSELSRYEKSIDYLRKSRLLHLHLGDSISAAQQNIDIAFVYSTTFRSKKALQAFHDAAKIYSLLHDTVRLAEVYYYIGQEFFENDMLDSTILYYQRSLEFDRRLNKVSDVASSYNNLGVIFYKKGDLVEAKRMLDSSFALTSHKKNSTLISIYYNNIGNVYFEGGDLDLADSLYRKSLSIKELNGDYEGKAATLFNIGNVYRQRDNDDSAIQSYLSSLEYANKQLNAEYAAKCYKALSELYKKRGDAETAFDYFQKYVSNMYSILADDDQKQMTESQEKYASTRKVASSLEREMKMQKLYADYNENIKQKEIQTAKEEARISRNWNYFFGLILFVIAAAVFITVLRNREKKKANKSIDEQNNEISASNKIIQKQADKLNESNVELEKLSIVAKETDRAILIMDAFGNFEWVNEAFTRIFGFTIDELISTISPNLIGDNTSESIKTKFDDCISSKKTVSYDFKTKSKSGEVVWVNVVLTPILDVNGDIRKLVSVDTDITGIKNAEAEILQQKEEIETQRDELLDQHDYVLDQKEEIQKQKDQLADSLDKLTTAQNKLVESEKMAALGNLVAGVAHEINTPVGIGLAASTTMYNKSEKLEELFSTKKMKLSDLQSYIDSATQACDLILTNLNRTAELVKSFKQVSIDNMTEQRREFVLDTYLGDIIRSLAPKIKHRPVEIICECPDGLKLISFPGAFAQIFTNFILNSMLHAFDETQKGIIRIDITTDSQNLIATYTDDGKGIPEENLSKIFDPFFTTNMQEGTGLGMNITYNIITQKLGGEIELESKEGDGVKFLISIPLVNLL